MSTNPGMIVVPLASITAVDAGRAAGADAGDAAPLHNDGAAVDDLSLVERDDPRIGQRHASRWNVAWHAQRERDRLSTTILHVPHVIMRSAPILERRLVAPAREEPAVA